MRNNPEFSIIHSYALIGFFVAVSIAAKFYPDWQLYSGCSVFLLMIHLLKVVPGVGAHSTTGIIGILLIFIIAVYCSPGALEDIITPITRMMAPPSAPIEVQPAFDVPIAVLRPNWDRNLLRMPRLGISFSSLPDILRFILGCLPGWWIVFDDTLGPGLMTLGIMQATPKKELKFGFAKKNVSCAGSYRLSPMDFKTYYNLKTTYESGCTPVS